MRPAVRPMASCCGQRMAFHPCPALTGGRLDWAHQTDNVPVPSTASMGPACPSPAPGLCALPTCSPQEDLPRAWLVPGWPGGDAGKHRQPAVPPTAGDARPWRQPEASILRKNKGPWVCGGSGGKGGSMQEAGCADLGGSQSLRSSLHPPGLFSKRRRGRCPRSSGSCPFPAQSSRPTPGSSRRMDGPQSPLSRCCVLSICTELLFDMTEGSRALQRGWLPLTRDTGSCLEPAQGRTAASEPLAAPAPGPRP